jgi:hypothetical protein
MQEEVMWEGTVPTRVDGEVRALLWSEYLQECAPLDARGGDVGRHCPYPGRWRGQGRHPPLPVRSRRGRKARSPAATVAVRWTEQYGSPVLTRARSLHSRRRRLSSCLSVSTTVSGGHREIPPQSNVPSSSSYSWNGRCPLSDTLFKRLICENEERAEQKLPGLGQRPPPPQLDEEPATRAFHPCSSANGTICRRSLAASRHSATDLLTHPQSAAPAALASCVCSF